MVSRSPTSRPPIAAGSSAICPRYLAVLGLVAAEHRVRPGRRRGDDGVPGGRSGWPPSRTTSRGSRTASTPRSASRASGSPAASGSASGWRAPWRRGAHAPALLVLDDPFSAVDVTTEAAIIASLRHAFGPEAPPERTGHHRPVLASPGGLPVRRSRARARPGRGGGDGDARRSPRGRRPLRAHLPGAARRRAAGDGGGAGDDRLRRGPLRVTDAPAPVVRAWWVCWRSSEARWLVVGLLVLAAAAFELAPPLIIRDDRRSPPHRRAPAVCWPSPCSTCSRSPPCRR